MASRHLLTAALLTLPAAALAQPAAPTLPPAPTPPAVGVTATRGARPIDEVPATVTITDDVQLERQSALRPSDVVRYEPGVAVGKVLTHRMVLGKLWGAGGDVQQLRVYVRQLRQKLEADPERPRHILTETGVGYRLALHDGPPP